MAVLQFTNAIVGNNNWSNVGNWTDYSTGSAPTSLSASDTYIVQVGALLGDPINLDAANLGHVFFETRGAAINVNLASYNAKSIVFSNRFGLGCPLNLTQAATVIAMDGTHSALAAAPNYGMPIVINGSLSSTSGNAISTLKFTLGGSTSHYLPSSGQMDCVIEVLSGSQARLQINPSEANIWANTYSAGGSATPIFNTTRQHDSLRLYQLLLPTNTTSPTAGGNQNTEMHREGVEYPQYTLEVGYGLASSLGILSTNNAILNLMGCKVIFNCATAFTLPADNLNTQSGMVQNTNPDSCTTVLLEDVELKLASGTTKCIVSVRNTFRAVSLTIGAGVFVNGTGGHGGDDKAAHIELIQKPTIRGTWNFEEQTDGFYKVMDLPPTTSTLHATHCSGFILKELRVDGYIKVKERATAPNSAAGFGMFWVDDAAPNTPMFTDDTGTSHNLLSGGGGGSTLAFKTIAVAGQSDVVADSATDTLTLVAGSNMTLTTNASSDTITFASAGGGGGGGYATIQNAGSALAQETVMDFTGVGVIASAATGKTRVDIPGLTLRDEGTGLGEVTSLDFVGAGVTATFGGTAGTITIPGGGGAATEVIEFVNSNTTINMNTTIAVCASNTDCTAKAGVTGAPWAGMTDFGGEFENYDFTATSGVFGAAQKGLVNVPVPTVGRKLTLVVPFICDGRTLPQGISQISCTGQSNAFIGHDLAGMVTGDAGRATQGSNVLLPESYLYGIWNDARRPLNTRAYLGHHAITLVGVPAPTGSDAALDIGNGATMGDVVDDAKWWVETNNEFLYDSVDRSNAPTGFFDTRGFGTTAWGQLYVVC